jgi:hypothetical protein
MPVRTALSLDPPRFRLRAGELLVGQELVSGTFVLGRSG